MDHEVRNWIKGLECSGINTSIYWNDNNGVAQYKTLTAVEFKRIGQYVSCLEAGIVDLVFKQMELERKP